MVKHMDQPLLQTSVDNDEKDAPQSSSTEWPQPHTNSGSWDTSGDAPQSSSKEWLNAWPQTYAKKPDWPQPNSWDHYTQWQHQQWPHGWSQPQWNTWEVNHTFYQQQKAAAESWGPITKGEHHQDSGAAASSGSTAVATETSPADVLQSQEQSAYWDDVQFLEKHEQKDRQRRRAHRWNLKERRWEAAERIAMLENDVTRCRPVKRTLSAQVMHFAQRKETETITKLSESLPKTPPAWTHQQQTSDDEQAQADDQQIVPPEPATKKMRIDGVDDKMLQLPGWMLESFQANQPDDGGLPHQRIDRKDGKFRWVAHSRVTPRLVKHTARNDIAPPIGIQMIEQFRQWQKQQGIKK